MKSRVVASVAGCVSILVLAGTAGAAELPQIKASEKNAVPACATPGRLVAFLRSRNAKLDGRFEEIAIQYMRHGEELGLRWDYAFFQMLVETGNLSFTGDVKPKQNNFAGLGATGGGVRGESFPDVSSGVRAHLEHVLMYTGERVENPVADRTRKVQEWNVLTSWQKTIKGPMTFAHLTRKWSPKDGGYARDIEVTGKSFYDTHCNQPDPAPQMLREARKGREPAPVEVAVKSEPAAEEAPLPRISGAELAKRAMEEARAEGNAKRSALGAASLAKSAETIDTSEGKATAKTALSPPVTLLNPQGAATDEERPLPVTAPPAATATPTAKPTAKVSGGGKKAAPAPAPSASTPVQAEAPQQMAAAATKLPNPASASGKCRVWTASYGGEKAIIIKSVIDKVVNFTVLDVNEGQEKREADAYISAYAKGGESVGEFASQAQALDKAFDLCPEG